MIDEDSYILGCMNPVSGPLLFIERFMYSMHPIRGHDKFVPFPFQIRYLRHINRHQRTVNLISRQMGKTSLAAGYLLWYAMFNSNSQIVIVSYNLESAYNVMSQIQYIYQYLPMFIRTGVSSSNKKSVCFDNGSSIIVQAMTPNACRGMSMSVLYLEEFAFVNPDLSNDFWQSVAPVLSSTNTKCILTSTPNSNSGAFYEIWKGASSHHNVVGANGFKRFFANWQDHPERDERWADIQTSYMSRPQFRHLHECDFVV